MKIYEDLAPKQKKSAQRWIFCSMILINGLILSLFVFYGVSALKEAKGLSDQEKFQISVSGEGRVFAKPDIVKITATVMTDKPALADAEKENSDLSNKVTEALKANNVAEKDIQTTSFNIYPQYSYPVPCYQTSSSIPCPSGSAKPEIVSYQIRNTLTITVRDVAKAGDILDIIVKSGVNEVSNFQLTIDDPKTFQGEARQKAIDDARAKAQAIASSLGKRLGRIAAFSESGSLPAPMALGLGGGDVSGKSFSVPSIQPGENEVVSSVAIVYELE